MDAAAHVSMGRLNIEPAPAAPFPGIQECEAALRGSLQGGDLGTFDEHVIRGGGG